MTRSTLRRQRPAPDTRFRDVLGTLEACLSTPVLPGELELWFENLDQALAQMAAALERQVGEVHPSLFSEISETELELRRNIVNLRKEDEEIAKQFAELREEMRQLRKWAETVEPNELAVTPILTKGIERGLWFVMRARKQETAIESWFLEAFNRENGTLD